MIAKKIVQYIQKHCIVMTGHEYFKDDSMKHALPKCYYSTHCGAMKTISLSVALAVKQAAAL
jgi:hypothetical protein